MSESLSPEQQELMAGYVLGDLDPDERATFQTLLLASPELEAEVLSLQEALGMMPLGLAVQEPPDALRNRILAVAVPQPSPIRKRWKRSVSWSVWVGSLAVGIAIILGWQNWQLRQQLAMRQPGSVEVLSADVLPSGWENLEEVLADHRNALTRSQGPADLATQSVAEVRSEYARRMVLPAQLPQLVKAHLLGGSFCELSRTQGIRLSYQTPAGEIVSFYQLMRSETLSQPSGTEMTLSMVKGPNVLVGGDQDYVYVLVGDVSVSEMWQLTATIPSI